ncbi:hypothetical protein [Poriferisphaera sp. WC338]|uniref:hypothetical protein n=1 Tax=Poriferisphaera sp. WC338 TaxID=3425129 RepID=UPI003D817174
MAKKKKTTKKKVSKKTPAKRVVKKVARKAATKKRTCGPGGVAGRPKGKTTGLGIQAYWALLFKQNASAAKKNRMTDAEISAAMHKEFPGRESLVFDRVSSVRNKYNNGGLTGGIIPAKESFSYDEDGNVREGRGRPKGSKNKPKKKATRKKFSR